MKKTSFQRLVRELSQEYKPDYRGQAVAVEAIQVCFQETRSRSVCFSVFVVSGGRRILYNWPF